MRSVSHHKEDVKAALRKRFGTLRQFEHERGLAPRSVTDVLRGKPSQPTAVAIANELGCEVHDLFPAKCKTANADCSNSKAGLHSHKTQVRA